MLIVASHAVGQPLPRTSYGIFGDYALNVHTANFKGLPGIPSCCPDYQSGLGSGAALGVLVRRPVSSSWDIELRGDYQLQSATLISTQPTYVLLNGSSTQGQFEYRMASSLSNIGVDALAGWSVVPKMRLMAGLRVASSLTSTFSQVESITQPEGAGTFLDSAGNDTHSRTRNQYAAAIPNSEKMQWSAIVGASFNLPVNPSQTLFLSPEILLNVALTDITTAVSWRANAVRAGVSLLYVPRGAGTAGGAGN